MKELEDLRRRGAAELLVICWACMVAIAAGSFWAGGMGPAIVALAVTVTPTFQILTKRYDLQTRLSLGLALPLYPAIMLWQWSGAVWMVDLHMAFFAAIAMLTLLADWRPVLLGAAVTAVHHLLTNFVAPALVFPDGADLMRVVLHAVIVVVETAVLIMISRGIEKLTVDQARAQEEKLVAEAAVTEERRRSEMEQKLVMEDLEQALRALARGDLAIRLRKPFPASYENLRSNFNTAATELGGIVRDVTGSAEVIDTGTSEISSATDDLARRTEQQASTLEHVASALGQLNVTVQENADSARELELNAGKARTDAVNSKSIVDDAASAMVEIESSANEIGQIISLIDGIAFQTNLLALNAGVEAARAGEAGKGFAVVATEVRALAQRTADAASEIKALIERSSVQVAQGVKLVNASGESLMTIVSGIAQINEAIERISQVSQAQASEITSLTRRVSELDTATQQNAAMVEEGTAAARQLSDEAGKLAEIVSKFSVSHNDRASGRAAGSATLDRAA